MSRAIILDSGPLGLVTHPRATPDALRAARWLQALLARGDRVIVAEIIDYELRRELLRAGRIAGVGRLDQLVATLDYEPITTDAMRLAASLWAQTRQLGRPTTDDLALDIDMILVAQATLIAPRGAEVVVATTNVRHLARFVDAEEWDKIS